MEESWYLGLDGGGTKTRCVLYDPVTDTMFIASGGTTNHEALPNGLEDLPQAIGEIVFPLLEKAGISAETVKCSAFGMSGVDTPMQHDIISQIIRGMGFGDFVLSNDAYLGIKAEAGRSGISCVNGTGYSVAGISEDGRMMQIGGHNDLTGDLGGSGYIVPAAVRAVYTALFKHGPWTSLTSLFYEWLGIGDRDELCQAIALQIYADPEAAYLQISRLLYRAAAEGDDVARGILKASGEDYALSIRCIAEDLQLTQPIKVVLIGSHFTKCECTYAIDALKSALEMEGDYRISVISTEPVAGALLWAMENSGMEIADRSEFNERIQRSFL